MNNQNLYGVNVHLEEILKWYGHVNFFIRYEMDVRTVSLDKKLLVSTCTKIFHDCKVNLMNPVCGIEIFQGTLPDAISHTFSLSSYPFISPKI